MAIEVAEFQVLQPLAPAGSAGFVRGIPLQAALTVRRPATAGDGGGGGGDGAGGGTDDGNDAGRPVDHADEPVSTATAADPALVVDVTIEAFDAASADDAERVTRTTVRGVTPPAAGVIRLPVGIPLGAERVRYRALVTERPAEPAAEEGGGRRRRRPERPAPVEALFPSAEETVPVSARAGDAAPTGTSVPTPSICEVLQGRTPSPSTGSGKAGVVAHLLAQLDRLRSDIAGAFDSHPHYQPLPGEIDGDGNEATGLAPWQQQIIELLTGSFYAYSPRRQLQLFDHAIGYPLAAVCNNNVDIVSWLRGATLPNQSNGEPRGIGFNCNGRSVGLIAGALGVRAQTSFRRDDPPPTAPFVHDFRTATDVDTAFRDWSFKHSRPGSIYVYGDPTHSQTRAHINIGLRVRRLPNGEARVQLFDTGAITARWPEAAPRALGVRGKALSEEPWISNLNAMFGTPPTKKCLAHAYFPVQGDRVLPRTPLGLESAQLEEGTGAVMVEADGASTTPVRDGGVWRVAPGHLREALLAQAQRALAHLTVLDRAGTLLYASRPLRLTRPLTHLVGAVANSPLHRDLEARWVVKLMGTWAGYLTGGDARHDNPVVQIFDDADGVARFVRPNDRLPDEFEDRFPTLWDAALSGFYTDGGPLKPRAEWPSAPWRDAALDDQLAAVVEQPDPGFADAIA